MIPNPDLAPSDPASSKGKLRIALFYNAIINFLCREADANGG
jgi:hypothetical protein